MVLDEERGKEKIHSYVGDLIKERKTVRIKTFILLVFHRL